MDTRIQWLLAVPKFVLFIPWINLVTNIENSGIEVEESCTKMHISIFSRKSANLAVLSLCAAFSCKWIAVAHHQRGFLAPNCQRGSQLQGEEKHDAIAIFLLHSHLYFIKVSHIVFHGVLKTEYPKEWLLLSPVLQLKELSLKEFNDLP